MHFGTSKVHFIRLEARFYVNGILKYDKVFIFYSPKESLFWIWLSRVPIFEGPKPVCHFYRYGPSLSDGVLHIINFGAPIIHCIGLETWFYVDNTFKYDKFCVFYSPNESLFWIWLSWVPIFEGPKKVCHFCWYVPSLSDGVLHILNFGALIVHCIGLETWFYINLTFNNDRFCVF